MTESINKATFEAAATLDIAAAKKAYPYPPKSAYVNAKGRPITFDDYILSGLHTLRAGRPDMFTADQTESSREWLTANNYPVPVSK